MPVEIGLRVLNRCAGQVNRENEVSRLACRRKHAGPSVGLVDWTFVVFAFIFFFNLLTLLRLAGHRSLVNWLKVNDRHLTVHLAKRCIDEALLFDTPAGIFHKETIYVHAFSRCLLDSTSLVNVLHFELEEKQVDRPEVLSCKSLQYACDEPMREEESRQPIRLRVARLGPVTHKPDAFVEVVNPRAERFQRRVGDLLPVLRDLVFEQRTEHEVERRAHQNDTLDGLLQVAQRLVDLDEQSVVLVDFLH